MGSNDSEIDRIKKKRMLDMQRRMLLKKAREQQLEKEKEKPAEPTNEEVLKNYLVGRAWEVIGVARSQYPQVMPRVEEALADAIKRGGIKSKIDGENLFHFLRQIGLQVRMKTTIRYKDHGELKSISQRLKEK